MINKASADFWSCFEALPSSTQIQARKQFRLFRENPKHPSLHFKELAPELVSVRVSRNYRALGRQREDDVILWFWIGSHSQYDRLIS